MVRRPSVTRSIAYEVCASRPEEHYFTVQLEVMAPDPEGEYFSLPAWIPGSYMIRDFARHIVRMRAESRGKSLPLVRLDKQRWKVVGARDSLLLEYQVYALDLSVRAAYLDTTHGFFNGTSLFLRVEGDEERGCTLRILPPSESVIGDWRVATAMPVVEVDERGFGIYRAEDYWHLVDCPVEMGRFQSLAFQVGEVPHRMVVTGRACFDRSRLEDDLASVCAQQVRLFGELPLTQYLFLVTVVGDGYGGLEHRDSTALLCSREDLPASGLEKPDRKYRRFLGLCSHEYFHLWNVKRIRPRRLAESDLSTEAYTELLWAFEGITSYYDDLALVRAGCIQTADYLEELAATITRVLRNPGRRIQSLAESSYYAWTKFYKQDENSPNAIVSYYAKGALVALGLDVTLRTGSDDRLSLDDLMRKLWREYGKTGRAVEEDGIQRAAEELLGEGLEHFFGAFVSGTEELPLQEWLGELGVGMRLRTASDTEDQGGYCSDGTAQEPEAPPDLGIRFTQQGDFLHITHVLEGGAAQQAGLCAGDRLISLEGLQVTTGNIQALLQRQPKGQPLEVLAFRRDELMRFEVVPKPASPDTCDLWLLSSDDCDSERLERRKRWLQL